ncbi:hypothetical protein ElyMa_005917300 [Elysia marginata]|uniref:MULE transposase domain-containing protein n=1 Tax=Elysia marginata TaxID=1093978 RepID=A0AAV4G8Y8_9GAST|nr:hypothetical protein ElyMa_005917300 [Elysia marginata]
MLTRFMDESSIHTMHVDLEIAMHSAIKCVLPNAKIKACQFHLAQAWFTKNQGLGLTPEYKDQDSDIGKWLRRFFALPVLHAEKIEETFVNVNMEDAPLDERCGRFADYILRNYIESALSDFPHTDFPPEIWTGTGTGNTTNSCESFHKYFGENFTSPHPNIYKFIEGLQNEQKIIIIKRQSIVNPVCRRKQKFRKERKMLELSRQY